MTQVLVMLGAALALFAGLGLALLIRLDRQRQRHRARLRRARPVADLPVETPAARRRRNGTATPTSLTGRMNARLAQAGLRIGATEVLVQVSLLSLGLYAALALLAGLHPLLALPMAVGLPMAGALVALRIARARYHAAFTETLPEALDVFARGLRAGRPVSDSISIVVKFSTGPVQREFARCHDEIRMGVELAASLARLEARVPTPEVSFFAVATALQSETGGNLIETMENLAAQLRERRKLRKKARALSSEARASAAILAGLPFAVALAILVLNPAYLAPLHSDPRGQVMAAAAMLSIGLGVFMMARMGKIDV